MAKVHLTPEDLEKCQLAKRMLENSYTHHHTNSQLARKVFINENKLKAGFKLITQHTIYEFVTQLRIEKAKDLLETTYLSVETIANRCGIDHSNLIRQFKKITGKTPRDWRNYIREIKPGYAS
jgi:transcriptional regulator GlxA family with amidase domain